MDVFEWVFSGVGVLLVSWIGRYFGKKRAQKKNTASTEVIIHPREIHKKDFRILFIDDQHKEFRIVDILKEDGWISTNSVEDITSLDSTILKNQDMVFVDINGVGTKLFHDEGLGLAAAIKQRYPNMVVIAYSAQTEGERFHPKLKLVDDSLAKNADPYEFLSLIQKYYEEQ